MNAHSGMWSWQTHIAGIKAFKVLYQCTLGLRSWPIQHFTVKKDKIFPNRVFSVICTNRGRIPKHEFSLVTLRQNVNQCLQRGKANALNYCTTKSPSLSNYHRNSPTPVTFSLPHRSKSELLSKVINLSAGSGIP